MILRLIKILSSVTLLLLATACDHNFKESMGITASKFDKLGAAAKIELLDNYYLTAEKRAGRQDPETIAPHAIKMQISGGSAMFVSQGIRLPYDDIAIIMQPNSCKTIAVQDRKHIDATSLDVCFWGNELQLDPSKIKPQFALASARIFYSSLWRDFTYKNISTFGYVSFKGINIRITMA